MASRLAKLLSVGVAASVMAFAAPGVNAHEMSQLHIHQKVQKGHHKKRVPQAQAVTNVQQLTTQQVVIEDTIEVSDEIVPAKRTVIGEQYRPTIWIDPDGCEHWVMDDGREGYMTPHTNRQGIPVCHRTNACGVMNTDQMFLLWQC